MSAEPGSVGIVQPGEMGAEIGARLVELGHRVLWASAGRSPDTRRRADAAGMEDAGELGALVRGAGVVLSVCPPHAALDVARDVAAHGFNGLYIDANAISPRSAATVGEIVTAAGARWVDGGIIGSPPKARGTTRLYLSGRWAADAAALFERTALEPVVLGDAGPTAASALKMAYAAWTKGASALLLDARALAEASGVAGPLRDEWEKSQPELAARLRAAALAATTKGWRWIAEMEEIAASMREAGLPDGFHQASADMYRRVTRTPPSEDPDETVADVLRRIHGRGE